MHKLEATGINFSYERQHVLKDISVHVEGGEFICLLGESGCGKSTFLRLLAGLSTPDSGTISLDGRRIVGAGIDRGVVFQDYSLFPWLSVGKNLELSLRQKFRKTPKTELRQIVLDALRSVGLDDGVYHKYPFELSGGMRQRCAICRAFAMDPPVLLLDEPFGALDAVTRRRLQHMILSLWKGDNRDRKTIFFVTHDVDEAMLLATRILVFGNKPSQIIFDHRFDGEKPSSDAIFENEDFISLRNTLIRTLNADITNRSADAQDE